MADPYQVNDIPRQAFRPDEVVVQFTGDALEVLDKLQEAMGLDRREEVVVQAVQLLYGAMGKEVLYRESSGRMEKVRVWR